MKLTRRSLLGSSLPAAAAALLAPALLRAAPGEWFDQARPLAIDGLGFPGGIGGPGEPLLPDELRHLQQSGLSASHLTVGEVGSMAPLEAFEAIVRDVTRWDAETERHPGVLARVRSADDIETARSNGRCGLIYGLQDGVAFEDDLERLTILQQLGIRVIQPTYNRRNLLGDGCMEPSNAGLSRDGVLAVERMQALGMLVDLSHCGRRTASDALALARRPMAFTHTGCFALAEHPRHRTDAELRAVAETGGVAGIFIMPYLARGKQPTRADVVQHIEHALQVMGEDHVSIGTDGSISPTEVTEEFKESFRNVTRRRKELGIAAPFETEEGYLFASDLNAPQRFAWLADDLLARGHSEVQVEKILGGNLLRVFRDSWGAESA